MSSIQAGAQQDRRNSKFDEMGLGSRPRTAKAIALHDVQELAALPRHTAKHSFDRDASVVAIQPGLPLNQTEFILRSTQAQPAIQGECRA
jgi:hypothetical protein